jgi:hypothetical protein
MAKQRSIDPGPMQRQLATPGQYEEFGREGVEGGYRAEWYPSESILFLEPKKFVIESRETQGAVGCPVTRRCSRFCGKRQQSKRG